MIIVTVNPGTSGTKVGYFELSNRTLIEKERTLFSGEPEAVVLQIAEHLSSVGFTDIIFGIRIVHGGEKIVKPTDINAEVLDYLDSNLLLAPLHNPISLTYIRHLQKTWPAVRLIAVVDTAFHAQMPLESSSYALPDEYRQLYGIKRYGFHGLAYQSIVRLMAEQFVVSPTELSLIALQLGSGCSICAIDQGRSVDTSMGFSPLEGLISRTRTGDIDPEIIPYLVQKTGKTYDELFTLLNTESGLAGMSKTAGHMNELIESSSDLAKRAFALFVYRIQKYIGAYQMVLQKEAPIVLSGGISEHSREFWEAFCRNPYLGVSLSSLTPDQLLKPVTRISADHSKRHMYVAFVDEEKEIAQSLVQEILLT
jgi:acetate kinase